MGKITSIHGGPLPHEPNAELVTTLEELLAEAKAGKLIALAYGTVSEDAKVGSGWDCGTGSLSMLGMAITVLSARYVQEFQNNGG
jgi:hypothetical protein